MYTYIQRELHFWVSNLVTWLGDTNWKYLREASNGSISYVKCVGLKANSFLFISYIVHLPEIVSHVINQYLAVNSRKLENIYALKILIYG